MSVGESVPDYGLEMRAQDALGVTRQRRLLIARAALFLSLVGVAFDQFDEHGDRSAENQEEMAAAYAAYEPTFDDDTRLEAAQFELYSKLTDPSGFVFYRGLDSDPNYGESLVSDEELNSKTVVEELTSLDDATLQDLENSFNTVGKWKDERAEVVNSIKLKGWDQSRHLNIALLAIAIALRPSIQRIVGHLLPNPYKKDGFTVFSKLDEIYSLSTTPLKAHPEWQTHPPSEEELKLFLTGVSALPPIGSKIVAPGVRKEFVNYLLPVRRLAEEVSEDFANKKNSYGKVFSHHLTIQGQLPDRFKYAALALVLNSPIEHDWSQPHYEAPWGKASPMIHDGGKTQRYIARPWRKVRGRTDFIQRIYLNFNDEGDTERRKLHALANEAESLRMTTETRFYQRAALALHCAEGSSPKTIPSHQQKELAATWDKYEAGMKRFIESQGIEEFDETLWFLSRSRKVKGWPDWRYEADYDPVQKVLQKIENIRQTQLDHYRTLATRAMEELANDVDRIIGID